MSGRAVWGAVAYGLWSRARSARSGFEPCVAYRADVNVARAPDDVRLCREHDGSACSQLALRRLASAAERAPGCAEPRPALAYRATPGLCSTCGVRLGVRRRGPDPLAQAVAAAVALAQAPLTSPSPNPLTPRRALSSLSSNVCVSSAFIWSTRVPHASLAAAGWLGDGVVAAAARFMGRVLVEPFSLSILWATSSPPAG